jgi:hypothetical protein
MIEFYIFICVVIIVTIVGSILAERRRIKKIDTMSPGEIENRIIECEILCHEFNRQNMTVEEFNMLITRLHQIKPDSVIFEKYKIKEERK